jgi:hypothetical protein
MAIEKSRNATASLSSKERRQLLFWGSILLLAMLVLIYLITPSGSPAEKSAPAKTQAGYAGQAASASLSR